MSRIKPISEREFQAQVIQLARLLGWWAYHTHDSRRSNAGFPDLVLVRNRVIYAELKTDRGAVRREQAEVMAALRKAGAEVYLWRPAMWDEIVATLKGDA